MARGMVPACRDNRPRSSTGNHRKATLDRLTEPYLLGPIYGLTPFLGFAALGLRGQAAFGVSPCQTRKVWVIQRCHLQELARYHSRQFVLLDHGAEVLAYDCWVDAVCK